MLMLEGRKKCGPRRWPLTMCKKGEMGSQQTRNKEKKGLKKQASNVGYINLPRSRHATGSI